MRDIFYKGSSEDDFCDKFLTMKSDEYTYKVYFSESITHKEYCKLIWRRNDGLIRRAFEDEINAVRKLLKDCEEYISLLETEEIEIDLMKSIPETFFSNSSPVLKKIDLSKTRKNEKGQWVNDEITLGNCYLIRSYNVYTGKGIRYETGYAGMPWYGYTIGNSQIEHLSRMSGMEKSLHFYEVFEIIEG